MVAVVVRVKHDGGGGWQVAAPDRDRITCQTLADARGAAYAAVARSERCELIVHDAYHRVLARELVNADPGTTAAGRSAEHRGPTGHKVSYARRW
jgi:hypothetical protein